MLHSCEPSDVRTKARTNFSNPSLNVRRAPRAVRPPFTSGPPSLPRPATNEAGQQSRAERGGLEARALIVDVQADRSSQHRPGSFFSAPATPVRLIGLLRRIGAPRLLSRGLRPFRLIPQLHRDAGGPRWLEREAAGLARDKVREAGADRFLELAGLASPDRHAQDWRTKSTRCAGRSSTLPANSAAFSGAS